MGDSAVGTDSKPFDGSIGRTLAESTSDWKPQPRRHRRPNVVVILCDDLGFSDIGFFGSEIDTPNIDALAARGAPMVNFHSTPLCSPSRAALITGLNHHEAGVGNLAHADCGFPGYRGQLEDNVATAAEVFRNNGYRTLMAGKWHLSRPDDHSDAGDRANWPLQRGFDRFYGFMESGLTNLHEPNLLHEDNHAIEVEQYPEGYYFTDDITDRAIGMIRGVKGADPATPFFLYLAHAAVHAPLMAKPEDMAKYRGRYDEGWDAVRAARFERQKALGVLPGDTELPPLNSEPGHESVPWDSLEDRQRQLFARYMEVYAAMVDNVDQNVGKLCAALAQLGELDNTIILFTSDNGASREGGANGTTEYYRTTFEAHNGFGDGAGWERDHPRLDLIGGPRVMAHYPRAWAEASNTPFRLHKGTTFQGGHHVAAVVSWPERIGDPGVVRTQYAHLVDVLPTLVDVLGLDVPTHRAGLPVKPMSGTSFAEILADANGTATHREQYYEMSGHRAYYRDGWEAVTLHRPGADFATEPWQLYRLTDDPAQARDVAEQYPELTADLAQAWHEAAVASQVYPLLGGLEYALLAASHVVPAIEPVTLDANSPTVERHTAARLTSYRSFMVRARLDHGTADRGIIVSHGDQGGGYCLYVDDDGVLTYAHNGYGDLSLVRAGTVPAGVVDIELAVTASLPAPAPDGDVAIVGSWDIRLSIDGDPRATQSGLISLAVLAPFEGIDVGRTRRSPVHWDLREKHGAFAYTGSIGSVTYLPGAFVFAPLQQGAERHQVEARYQ